MHLKLKSRLYHSDHNNQLSVHRLFESVARSCMQKQTGSQAAMARETHQQHETTTT